MTSHLRAFYTQLLRNVKERDLTDERGKYFMAATDVAIDTLIRQLKKYKNKKFGR